MILWKPIKGRMPASLLCQCYMKTEGRIRSREVSINQLWKPSLLLALFCWPRDILHFILSPSFPQASIWACCSVASGQHSCACLLAEPTPLKAASLPALQDHASTELRFQQPSLPVEFGLQHPDGQCSHAVSPGLPAPRGSASSLDSPAPSSSASLLLLPSPPRSPSFCFCRSHLQSRWVQTPPSVFKKNMGSDRPALGFRSEQTVHFWKECLLVLLLNPHLQMSDSPPNSKF